MPIKNTLGWLVKLPHTVSKGLCFKLVLRKILSYGLYMDIVNETVSTCFPNFRTRQLTISPNIKDCRTPG